jgi:hypothetical protein
MALRARIRIAGDYNDSFSLPGASSTTAQEMLTALAKPTPRDWPPSTWAS